MGNNASPEALAVQWADICNDPLLRDLPYKIELNAWGKIEMSPASNRHGRFQFVIGTELQSQLADGFVITEASILTDIGVRVPDVVWASAAFVAAHGDVTPYPRAPEICVEVVSPSNFAGEIAEKTRAYLAAGAVEVWIAAEDGSIRYFDNNGQRAGSGFPVTIRPLKPL
ncbi:MAG: Uma2 family endonuclease [Burkholderiales bacterium]